MNKFEDFLKEGKKIQIKRKYTENHPAQTVGKTASVRNEILKAVKDGVITEEEFTKILSKLSTSPKRWRSTNSKYFFVSEEGIKLSKWGRRILSEVEEAPKLKAFPICEATVTMDAMNPGDKTFLKFLKKNKVEIEILTMKGPAGYPEVKMTGSRKDLETVLSSEDGWDDPDLAEYIEESIVTRVMVHHLDTLAELVGNAKDFMSVGKELKKGKYKYEFGSGMMPHYQVEADGFTFMIVNKRHVDRGDREVNGIAIGLLENIKTEITNMENTFLHESFESFTGANGFLNEKLGSQILASILMGNKEGKYGKKNLSTLAGGFYQMTKVALDKIQDEDFIVDNDPSRAFKNHGGSKNIIFFISDNAKENPYLPSGSYSNHGTVPGGGILLAAMGGDREFYTNDWSRYSRNRSWKKDGKKGSEDQIGVNKKYRGWDASGLNNGKRIAEVSDRVIIVNLELIRQKYSTEQLRDARQSAKAGAIAFKSDKDFKADNKNRYHKILATKAASMPIDKMVQDAIDELANQIKDGLASGKKTKYDEILIGTTSKGREAKLRDASNHMSNILDNYSRYCSHIRQGEESESRYGQSESYYERESKNYAKEIKDQIAKIKGFDYAW
jgi:hypothetical protein